MTMEQLVVTCQRLQTSRRDMEMLLNEFEEEQVMLRREHDRLHRRVEKAGHKLASLSKKDSGIIRSAGVMGILCPVERQLEVSHLVRTKEERKAAKRRRWTGAEGSGRDGRGEKSRKQSAAKAASGAQDMGPFSDEVIQMSWGNDVSHGVLRPHPLTRLEEELERWVRDSVSGDPVAEDEPMTESQQVWSSQFGGIHQYLPPVQVVSDQQQRGGLVRSGEPQTRRTVSRPRSAAGSPKSQHGELDAGIALRREVSQAINAAADIASSLLAAEPSSSSERREGSPPRRRAPTFHVELRRQSHEGKWGVTWDKIAFRERREYYVERLEDMTPAKSWNIRQQEHGHLELRIQPGDRLLSANGKTHPDEIKKELTGQDVALEFERPVTQRSTPSEGRKSSSPEGDRCASSTPVVSAAPGPLTNGTPSTSLFGAALGPVANVTSSPEKALGPPPRKAFQAAFTEYLTKVAPTKVAAEDDSSGCGTTMNLAPLQLDLDESLVAAGDGEAEVQTPTSLLLDPASLECKEEHVEKALDASPAVLRKVRNAPPASEVRCADQDVPDRLVVQVLSLAAGSLRLSWCYDWAKAPPKENAEQYFEVFYRQDAQEEGDSGAEERREFCRHQDLSLDVAVGRRYTFEVRAVLLIGPRDDDAKSDLDQQEIHWSSAASATAVADLRVPTSPVKPAVSAAPGGANEPVLMQPPQRRRGVASSLGTFLAQRPALGSTPTVPSFPSAPISPTSPTLPGAGQSASFSSSPPKEVPAPVVMGGSVVSPKRPKTLSPTRRPRDSAAALDPIKDKEDVAELLRLRRGGLPSPIGEANVLRQRSLSCCSDDDGSLAHLSSFLSNLEKVTASKFKEESGAASGEEARGQTAETKEAEQVPRSSGSKGVASAASAAAAAASAAVAPAAAHAAMATTDEGWEAVADETRLHSSGVQTKESQPALPSTAGCSERIAAASGPGALAAASGPGVPEDTTLTLEPMDLGHTWAFRSGMSPVARPVDDSTDEIKFGSDDD